MIVFHKKGEFAGMVRIGGEQAESFWDADGFHDTETRRKVDAPENAGWSHRTNGHSEPLIAIELEADPIRETKRD